MTWQIGTRLVDSRSGAVREVVRITPAGASGTRVSDGPVFHAQIVDTASGEVIPRGHVADVWRDSVSYPTSAYAETS